MKDDHPKVLKDRLRRQMLRSLLKITCEEKAFASSSVVAKIRRRREFHQSKRIGLFWAVDWEIDLLKLIDGKIDEKQFAMPRWRNDLCEYEFAEVRENQIDGNEIAENEIAENDLGLMMIKGRFGIEEPAFECGSISSKNMDLIFVPGLAFSRNGDRLGRGKGHYDRLLSSSNAMFWGVCHQIQIVDSIATEDWDLKMDKVITPETS